MAYYINNIQLHNLIDLISNKYLSYAPQKYQGKVIFDLVENFSDLRLFHQTIIPFKKILFPDKISKNFLSDKKMALVGLYTCDVHALDIFLKQFTDSPLVPKRNQLFILSVSCKPDDDCFCDIFSTNKITGFDLYVQKENDRYSIFVGSAKGKLILDKLALKESKKEPKIRQINIHTEINKNKLEELVSNCKINEEFWQGVSNNCFGCGACTAVCPLCFCVRQNYQNKLDSKSKECLAWDSCFADDFFKISNGFDFKPKNVDRLYNWYHHKFVRAPKEINQFLCVGCGRCIKACPAHLNIKNILNSLEEKNNN